MFTCASKCHEVYTQERIGDETIIFWSSSAGLFVIVLMMLITYLIMIACGIRVCRTLKVSSISQKSKKLQAEMLRALIVQVCDAVFFSSLPLCLL